MLAAGKGAAAMAAAFEQAWQAPCEGLAVTRYGHKEATRYVEVVEAGHPVPDENGVATAQRFLDIARGATSNDLVVMLISGGASSLLSLPADGVALAEKQALTRKLLASGCPISELNRFRIALSAIKGGRLAAAIGDARLVTYAISDVPGDDPALIGSGPTVYQPVAADDALAIARRYDLDTSASVRDAIKANAIAAPLARSTIEIVAKPTQSLEAAAEHARKLGLAPLILGDRIEGEAREVAKVLGGMALACHSDGYPARPPAVLLSGGETTVTVNGSGRGGRNAEFLLSLFAVSEGRFSALAADTDGIDGIESNAGAWFDGNLFATASKMGLSPKQFLTDNDAYSFFEKLGSLITTGPTRTNVNDFRAILIR